MPALPKARDEKLAQNLAKGIMTDIEACRDAGYTGPVWRKVKQPKIQERVTELRQVRERAIVRSIERDIMTSAQVAHKLGIDREKIIQSLWWNAQRCLRGQPVIDRKTGEQIPGRYSGKPDAAGANQALKLIGMECFGMFVERVEVGGPGDFSRLSDAEFDEKLKEEALAAGLPEDAVAGLLTYNPPEDGNENQS